MNVQKDMRRLSMFRGLHPGDLAEVADVLTPFTVGPGETLLVEGEKDDSLLLVVEGELEVSIGDPPVRLATVGINEMLGDMALFGRTGTRSATVSTLVSSRLLLIERDALIMLRRSGNPIVPKLETQSLRAMAKRLRDMNELIARLARGTELGGANPESMLKRLTSLFGRGGNKPTSAPPIAVDVLKESPLFTNRDPAALQDLAERLDLIPIERGSIVIPEGTLGEDAYIVAAGKIDVYRATMHQLHEKVAILERGAFFGLVALVQGSTRSATCFAAEPSWLLRVPGPLYKQLETSDTPASQVLRAAMYEALRNQLNQANMHVDHLARTFAEEPQQAELTERELKAYRGLVSGVTAYSSPSLDG